ncbi:MAG: uroporphyrinogen decarboxylase [Pirellulales bacterium]|nr:uroporphyrinogen decarboxylase [Pirellulales bacterium]
MTDSTPNFNGLRLASFESRRADDMRRMIEKFGGEAFVSPSMREVEVDENRAAIDFANRVITGQIDVVILMTGVGIRHLLSLVERHVDREQFLAALSDTTTIARGPKPIAVLAELGLKPTHRVPEPNTWREVLSTIDAEVPIANLVVGVQEYGKTNVSLIAGLEARGASVERLEVYRWALPEDIGPMEQNLRAICAGERDVVMFTSSPQLTNLLSLAESLGLTDQLRAALRGTVIASIGPTTSETLRAEELPVDLEPTHSKMGHLVTESAERAAEIVRRKQQVSAVLQAKAAGVTDEGGDRPAWYDGPFMKACRLEATDVTPVWLMRQAGRYMEEYRRVREKVSFLDLCNDPALCSEVMCTAVNKLGVDAAIIFADLLPILQPMGMDLEFAKGEGPLIHNPIRESEDVDRLLELDSADALHATIETVRQTRADLPPQIPVIGFAGAPFTLASYAIEGGASRNYLHTKTLMYRDAGAWDQIMQRLVRAVSKYLAAQIAAGAQVVQLFDSWAGCLGVDDYRRFVMPHTRAIIDSLPPGVPVLNFATGNPALLPSLAEAGGTVIGIDWRVRLADAWQTVGYDKGVQGNLEPISLMADLEEIRRRTLDVLDQAAGRPGHIFNLGHGILPQTPVDNAIALVDMVHELSAR